MTNNQIPSKSQFPNPKVKTADGLKRMPCGKRVWHLSFGFDLNFELWPLNFLLIGIWDLFGIWDLRFGY
ncbi:MAG: hypothetical protein NT009_08435 [Proteobacteria bacterium]|nr:hypothetical protein [Pseudomonadota bacterium]